MFSKRMTTIITTVAIVGLGAGTAVAGGPSAPLARTGDTIKVDRSVKKLPFGKGMKATLRWIGKQMRGSTAYKMAMLKKLKKSVVEFTPSSDTALVKRTVIGDEFKAGNGESMLRWNDGRNEHYFFFYNKKLYKYAKPVLVPPTTLGFVDRVNMLSKHLGAPTGTLSPNGDDNVVEARWVKSKLETRIVDKRAKFNADVLLVKHYELNQKVENARRGQGPNGKKYDVDDDLKEFLE